MKILVIGKNGQLGRSFQKILNDQHFIKENLSDFTFVGREELDLGSKNNISNYFQSNSFDIIINCAAYTAVDKAEQEKALANQINHLAVSQLSEIAKEQNAKFVHFSTDYVFDGENNKSYMEMDKPNPINVYGETKLAGEKAIQDIMPTDAIIIRTSWVYSEFGSNFVKTILKLSIEKDKINVIDDQIGSPTYAADLAALLLEMLQHKKLKKVGHETQIYHYSNEGEISWYDFAKEIIKIAKIDCKVMPISTNQYQTSARRPRNTLLNKSKLSNSFNVKIHNWKNSIQTCIKNMRYN